MPCNQDGGEQNMGGSLGDTTTNCKKMHATGELMLYMIYVLNQDEPICRVV